MMMNFPLEAWHIEKIRESVSEFGKFLVWNRDGSNRARVLVKIRVPDLLEIPISHVLCENTDDAGHGQSWTVVNYILQANLIAGEGADEDPLPPNGMNPHPMPNLPFDGIWNDADFVEHGDQDVNINNVAPNLNNAAANPGHVAPAAAAAAVAGNEIPIINTPPQSPHAQGGAHNLQPAIEAMESFNAMHNLVNDIITNLPSAIDKLDMENISGASFKLLDVSDEIGSEKKAMITIYSVQPAEFQSSQCIIQEIEEEHTDETSEFSYDPIDDHEFSDAMLTEPEAESDTLSSQTTPAKKKQKKLIRDVSEVRRSQRIAKICDGFKDKEA
jgi:hypothetical protein